MLKFTNCYKLLAKQGMSQGARACHYKRFSNRGARLEQSKHSHCIQLIRANMVVVVRSLLFLARGVEQVQAAVGLSKIIMNSIKRK